MEGRLTPEAALVLPAGEPDAAGYPLSPQQRRVWSLAAHGGRAVCSVACAVEVEGVLEEQVLAEAWSRLVARHEILRVRFRRLPALSFPVQVVAEETAPKRLPSVDLSGLGENEQRRRIAGLLAELARGDRSPDDPPLTVRRIDRGRQGGALLLSLTALSADFATLDHLLAELARACGAAPAGAPGLQYPDAAELFRQLAMAPAGDPPAPPAADLLADPGESPEPAGFMPQALRLALDAGVLAALETVAWESGLPLSALLLAGWQWLLGCATGETRALTGVAFDGRIYEGMEGALGPYTRYLPLGADLDRGRPFLDLAAELSRRLEDLAAIQDWLTPELALGQAPGAAPRFTPFCFRFEEPAANPLFRLWRREGATERFHLELACRHADGALALELRYDLARFGIAEAGRLASHLEVLCRGVARSPDARLGELALAGTAERHQLLFEANDTAAGYGAPRLLHSLFEEQAARAPSAVAVCCGDESLTYGELDARADRLAVHLAELGVGPDAPVAIHVERSPALVVAILAVLKSGGAYLPLDPEYPRARLEQMLEASGAAVLLTERRLGDGLAAAHRVELDAVEPVLGDRPAHPPRRAPCRAVPDHLAYLLFTSGSTGAPKGVMVSHRAIVNHMRWMQDVFPLTPEDRVLQKTPASFDASVWEFFAPLLTGARLVLAPPGGHRDPAYLASALRQQRVTILQVVPTLLRLLLAEPAFAEAPDLRRVFCGGEALPSDLRTRFATFMKAELINVYGPTEATIHATSWLARGAAGGVVPIGEPVGNARIYLVAESGEVVPAGMAGELWVGGAGLARGYLGDPAQTAERFVPDPWSGEPGARLYRTGDRARLGVSGQYEFLGRLDHQVKIRGFRVEPAEIEATLRQSPLVSEAVVGVRVVEGDRELVAYVVLSGAAGPVPDLGDFLRARLPDPMVPSRFIFLDALPLMPSGKVDRGALPESGGEPTLAAPHYVAPRDLLEERIAALWAEVLKVERIGVEDDFFSLGGHSLLAIRLVSRLRAELEIELPLGRLFAAPTVAGLAAAARERGRSAAPVIAATPDPAREGEPFPLTRVQQAYWIGRRQGLELGGVGSHEYLEVDGQDLDAGRLCDAWRRLVDRHGMLRAVTDAEGRQRILSRVEPYEIRVFDLRGLDEPAAGHALRAIRHDLSHQLFTTEAWPLFALGLSRWREGRCRLHLSLDLLICDAVSLQILARELVQLYVDPGSPLPARQLSFRDYVLATGALEKGEDFERSRDYWLARVATLPAAPQLPLAQSPAMLASPRFSRRGMTLPAASWGRLLERARRASLSPPAVLLASFAEVLATWSRSRSFTLNLPVANRLPLHPEVGEVVGDFTTLCLLEIDFTAPAPFATRARRLQDRLWEDLDHRHFHGIEVLREVARAQGRSGGMPVVFTSTLGLEGEDASASLARLGEVVYRLTQTPQVWLDLLVSELADGLHLDWDAVDALFPPGLLDAMSAAHLRLLTALAEGEAAWESAAWPLLPEEQRRRREEVNATAAPIPPVTLHTLFAEQARRYPERLALVAGEARWTYGELLTRAESLCGRLRAAGVRPGVLVAVVLDKGWEQAVAVLAVLGAGAAYLPLDPELPAERLASLLAQGQAVLAVTRPELDARLSWPAGVERILVEAGETTAAAGPFVAGDPDDLAYVMFTSGSTGVPKGAMVRHRGLVNAILDTNRRFGVGPEDRVLALTALHHDMSVYDLLGLLAAGGAVVIPEPWAGRDPRRWTELVEREGVTIWNSVPTLLLMLVEQLEGNGGPAPRSLRLAFTGGDWIPLDLPDRARALLPGLALVSVGGPTETSLWNILHPIGEVEPGWKSVPYGRPIANTRYYVLGEALEDRPDWVPGELYAAGVGLAAGYFQDEERTRASFLHHPGTGERLYRTGDLGRYLPSGDLEFLGREDLQVKLQGQRIELGEIEAALVRQPAVQAAVVVAAGERGRQRLVAFVVLARDAGLDTAERIDFKLAQHGLRRDRLVSGRVDLPGGSPERSTYAERRSFRRFLPETVPLGDLGRLLASLSPVELEGLPVPKRRYPSAGGLYAVDVYLYVKAGRVGELACGTYAYAGREHGLVPLRTDGELDRGVHAAINREVFDGCAFSLFLVGRLTAVTAAYGKRGQEFCWIEAGAIGQLLMAEAPRHRIGLCPVGRLDPGPVRDLLALGDDQVLLHSFLGGGAARDLADSVLLDSLVESAGNRGDLDERLEELRASLSRQLPGHMIPAEIVPVERLPLNANGKVDRRALAERTGWSPRAAGSPRPRTDLERTIAAVWREVLGVEEVGRDQAFFELGGNSLHLVQAALRLGRRLGRELTVGEIFRHPTVGALAEHLGEPGSSESSLTGIAERAERARQAGRRGGSPRVDHG